MHLVSGDLPRPLPPPPTEHFARRVAHRLETRTRHIRPTPRVAVRYYGVRGAGLGKPVPLKLFRRQSKSRSNVTQWERAGPCNDASVSFGLLADVEEEKTWRGVG